MRLALGLLALVLLQCGLAEPHTLQPKHEHTNAAAADWARFTETRSKGALGSCAKGD